MRVKTPPIPKLAMPVVKLLRETVPHPGCEPAQDEEVLLYATTRTTEYCPVGLAPWITLAQPGGRRAHCQTKAFIGSAAPSTESFWEFINWVDGPGSPKVKDRMLGLKRID